MKISGNSIEIYRLKTYPLRRLQQSFLFCSAPLFHSLYLSLSFLGHVGLRLRGMKNAECKNRDYPKKAEVDLVVCIVAGPGQLIGILDILDSIRKYLDGIYRVIVVDDSCTLKIWSAIRKNSEVDYIRNWKRLGIENIYESLLKAYLYALKNYRFKALLRIDTDALITGQGLVHDIVSHFAAHPEAGMLGSYRVTCTGGMGDFSPIASQFQRNLNHWGQIIEKAQKNGYEIGEHAQGGAYVLSFLCLQDMYNAGYLKARHGGSYVAEDGIFSLYVRALGYEIHDFAKNGPFAIAWRGLPIPKEEVVRQGKKVIHSVKFTPEDLQIREYFRRLRDGNG